MCGGVGKSGSPAPNPTTSTPAAWSAFALASTASVADSVMAPTRREILTASWWHGASRRGARFQSSGDDRFRGRIPRREVREARIVGEDLDDGSPQAEPALDHADLVLLVPQHERDRDA